LELSLGILRHLRRLQREVVLPLVRDKNHPDHTLARDSVHPNLRRIDANHADVHRVLGRVGTDPGVLEAADAARKGGEQGRRTQSVEGPHAV
jgi:hypothetical protein